MNKLEYAERNSIARGVWNVSPSIYKVISFACAKLLKTENTEWAEIDYKELLSVLGLKDGTETRKIYKQALESAFSAYIEYEIEPDTWIKQHWFSNLEYKKDWQRCRFRFNPDLVPYLREKNNFFVKNLHDISQLKSSYAITYYTIGQSYFGLAGKGGNKAGEWFFYLSVDKLRKVLAVKKDEYLDNYEFFRRCVKAPVDEINKKKLDFTISVEKVKEKKTIIGYKFLCSSNNMAWHQFVNELKQTNRISNII